jgi:uncharacterized OsmC-like protein
MQYTSVVISKDIPIDSLNVTARGHHSLAQEASDRCFVENTLAKAIPVTTELHLNGKKIRTSIRGPQ